MGRNASKLKLAALGALAALAGALLAACGGGAAQTTGNSQQSAGPPRHGGTLTVLEESSTYGAWNTGLDPATTTTGGANQSEMDAIYGELFELGSNGQTVDDLATGYTFENGGRSLVVTLRKDVTFSDGTPFNASAVVWNYERDFASPTCTCVTAWPVTKKNPFQVVGPYQVRINFSQVYGPAVHSFHDSSMNWIASPTAVQKMGEQSFKFMPVGAGPFIAVKDVVSSEFVVKRNPDYWQAGRPYLDGITFRSVASGEPMLEAMEAGQGQVVEGMADPSLVSQYQQHGFVLTPTLGTAPYFIQLNTEIPPFNNQLAREAIYYATNAQALNQQFFSGHAVPTQTFTGPGGLFYQPTVPDYRAYDLAKAQAIVKQLGGLQAHLAVVASSLNGLLVQALQNQWEQAGIKVTLAVNPLATQLALFKAHQWQSILTTMGSFDPATGLGVNVRMMSGGPYSGVSDPALDRLMVQGETELSNEARSATYAKIAKLISDQAYGPFLFTLTGYTVAAKGVQGPGVTTSLPSVAVAVEIHWEDVSTSS